LIKSSNIIQKYILLYVHLSGISLLLQPIRLLGLWPNMGIYINIIKLVLSTVLFIVFLELISKVKINFMESLFISFTLIPVIFGFYNNIIMSSNFRYWFSDTYNLLLFTGLIILFKNFSVNQFFYEKASTIIYRYAIVTSVSFIILRYIGLPNMISFGYPILFFALYYFYFNNYKYKFYFTSLIIIFGGKRGVIFTFFVLGFLLILLANKNRLIKIFSIFIITIFIVLIIIFTSSNFLFDFLPEFFKPSLAKFKYVNPLHNDFNLNVGLGGRIREIQSVIKVMNNDPLLYITGMGAGATYINLFNGNLTHNLHFSPLSQLSKYGFFYTILFYYYIIKVFINNFIFIIKNQSINHKKREFLLFFSLSIFIYSFSAYAYYVITLFPISIALLRFTSDNY